MKLYFCIILICFLVAVFVSFMNTKRGGLGVDILENLCCGVATAIACGFICFLFFAVGSIVATEVATTTEEKYFEKPIYSLQDNMATNSRFTIGRGYIDSSLRYYFLANTKYGYKVECVNSDNAYLVTDGESKIEFYNSKFENKIIDYLFDNLSQKSTFYVLHIPKDTIEINYNIDLQ